MELNHNLFMKHWKYVLELILFLAGLVLFGFVVKFVGAARLAGTFSTLKGTGWIILFFYPFMCIWDVFAWRMVFGKIWRERLRFPGLFAIRFVGEAVNNITPIVDVGGEPLKVVLVFRRFEIPKIIALASVILSRTALFIGEIIFMIVGLVVSFFILPLSFEWRVGLTVAVFIFMVFSAFFTFAQKKGLFVTFIQWLDFFQFDPALFKRFHIPLQKIDEEIASFYSHERKSLQSAVFFHTIGWFAGGIEMYFMLHLLGVHVSLVQAVMMEALLQLVRTASFFIPGNLGTQEAGLAFFIQLLGYHPALGVAVSLLKRARQIVWTGIGFAIWGVYQLIHIRENSENKEKDNGN